MNKNNILILICILSAITTTGFAKSAVKPKKASFPKNTPFTITKDSVVQGEWEAKVISPTKMTSLYGTESPRTWELKTDVSGFPKFSAPGYPILETLYNMALEETLLNIRKEDGAFMAGAQWNGVWTRDISYSIHLSLAMIQPQVSIKSLQAKVSKENRIIQDTGTGGSWPVSTDRVVWAIAAWEIYKSTGDKEFLKWAYQVMKNTVEQDRNIAWDEKQGLFYGESSFLDWREQTYPLWMEPVDIYEGKTLGTSALHYEIYSILSSMSRILTAPAGETETWDRYAGILLETINKYFWLGDKQYYSAYLYPALLSNIPSDKSESLGEALAVLFKIADPARSQQVISHTPLVHFGVPCIYPQQAHTGPYHNKAIWPFVEAYFLWAAATTGNETVVSHTLQNIIRPAALFLTHKENMVYDTGHSAGTAINSDRQLWSVAGYLGSVYRVLFGMQMDADSLGFSPFIPDFVTGPLSLKNFPYRGASLDITVSGKGNVVTSLKVDGVEKGAGYRLPASLSGRHQVNIQLKSGMDKGAMNLVSTEDVSPMEVKPEIELSRSGVATLSWKTSKKAAKYLIWKDNKPYQETTEGEWSEKTDRFTVYSVQAVDETGLASPLSRPLLAIPAGKIQILEAEKGSFNKDLLGDKYKDFSGSGYVESPKDTHQSLGIALPVKTDGQYLIRLVYANGKGPINTDNKCAIRSLKLDGQDIASIIMPQRGNWGWGYANSVMVTLKKGKHELEFYYDQKDENMNVKVNYAVIDRIELIQMD